MIGLRKCSKCGETKELTAYYKDPKGKEGLYAACKTCHAIAVNKWQVSHREKMNAIQRHFRRVHPEKRSEVDKAYRKNNPEKRRDQNHRRRALKSNAVIEQFSVKEIYERDGWICQLCKKKVNKKLKYPNKLSASIDHIIPLSKGGSHSRSNTHLAHWICNAKAGVGGIKQTILF